MTEPFIYCDGLVKIYRVAEIEVVALQGLNFSVQSGELMGIVGASGSGKSTLMNILGGLDRPTAGHVRVGDHDLLKMSDGMLTRYRREQVGFVWQQSARNLVPYLNAVENVELPMTLAGASGKEKRNRAKELLSMVSLGDRMFHTVGELSGGEQQRVSIAVSLANNPSLLLADEPTGEVDSNTAQVIYDTLRYLNTELKLTMILVSHDPGIARHVDRVVAIRDGMMSSETRRQVRTIQPEDAHLHGDDANGHHEVYEELVVLDRAGRLQVPKEFLEQFQIRGRAILDITEEGILIRPAPEDRNAPELVTRKQQQEADLRRAKKGGIGGMWQRLRKK